jgi:hypothetical protein
VRLKGRTAHVEGRNPRRLKVPQELRSCGASSVVPRMRISIRHLAVSPRHSRKITKVVLTSAVPHARGDADPVDSIWQRAMVQSVIFDKAFRRLALGRTVFERNITETEDIFVNDIPERQQLPLPFRHTDLIFFLLSLFEISGPRRNWSTK